MKAAARRALIVAVVLSGFLAWLHVLGIGLKLLLAIGILISGVTLVAPYLGMRWLDELILQMRSLYWRREHGQFHSFAGVPLDIEDDGRWMWVAADSLQRALGMAEPEGAIAARHAGRWQRTPGGVLMLRVDAVVAYLNTMRDRHDPRVLRLRRYFERDVLYPARQRRQRARQASQ